MGGRAHLRREAELSGLAEETELTKVSKWRISLIILSGFLTAASAGMPQDFATTEMPVLKLS
jgi:hypothetical protein